MILLGVTGGIGMGKSTAALLLTRLGVPVIDTDQLARDVVAPGQPALLAIRDAFGDGMFHPDGSLDRARMAERVFADPDARLRLEEIVHPPIRDRWTAQVDVWRKAKVPAAAVVIPLLYETKAETRFDAVLCVACPNASQLVRLRGRGWSDDQIRRRLGAQMPIDAKMLRADFLIWTEPPVAVHEAQLRRTLASLGIPATPTATPQAANR